MSADRARPCSKRGSDIISFNIQVLYQTHFVEKESRIREVTAQDYKTKRDLKTERV